MSKPKNTPPRFAIIDDCDRPYRNNVAEWIDGVGYCYMTRTEDKLRRRFDGMQPPRPTALEDFGIAVLVRGTEARFVQADASIATYPDGMHRRWDGPVQFTLPLVTGVRPKRRAKKVEVSA